jgi:UDP-N-acetylmuramyl pentapeptide phosphotransferase/UDP-N-acetylglucosamine-1-phosphate transferase
MISVFAIPSITYVAHLKNLLDKPNLRTVHSLLTPRLGGLAIFAGMVSSLMLFGVINSGVQHLLAGAILIYYIGLKDDIVSVSAFKKFFVQILAAGIVVFMGDIRITSFQGILGIHELPMGLSYAFSFLVIIGLTNSINLIDGLDGLAGSIIVVILTTFGFYFYLYGGENFKPFAYVAFSLVGGMVGFLRYNFYKATIFMGDTGSLISGFVIAVLTIQFVEMKAIVTAPSIGIAILFVPMFDTLRVFSLRLIKGVSPFAPDKNHIHHILIDCGMSQVATVITLIVINIATIIFVSVLKSYSNHVLLIVIAAQSFVLVVVLEFLKRKIIKTV